MKYFRTCGQLPAHVSDHVSFSWQPLDDVSHIELIVSNDKLTYSVTPPLPLIHIQYIYIFKLY